MRCGLDPGLVAWWPLDEGAGTAPADGSGNGKNSTVEGRALCIPAQAREPQPADVTAAWPGDVWTFSTREYALIDGFQTYIDNRRFGRPAP